MTHQHKACLFYLMALIASIMLLNACATKTHPTPSLPVAILSTNYGNIHIELDVKNAPISANNFINYINAGHFKALSFYRTVNHGNDNHNLKIGVLQGGLNASISESFKGPLAPINHESTKLTTLTHNRGAVSLARGNLGSAQSEFFISTLNNPHLDEGGLRHPDKQGFAVFGRVVKGMDVVDTIAALPANGAFDDPYVKGQVLSERVAVNKILLKQ
ncbi:peptidylprolyl isomerase [Glaciecola sp. 2405UD65-10]|uniref:peptidylprolyl isomerase n=1 Tax=Glaciecola sp. 2405UD65-10 TaxID=3397244 RepID=UPI003B5CE889